MPLPSTSKTNDREGKKESLFNLNTWMDLWHFDKDFNRKKDASSPLRRRNTYTPRQTNLRPFVSSNQSTTKRNASLSRSFDRMSATKTTTDKQESMVVDLPYVSFFEPEFISANYLESLKAVLEIELGVLDQKATDLARPEQNRCLLQQAMEQNLEGRINNIRAYATLPRRALVFSKNNQRQLSTIAKVGVFASIPATLVEAPVGITFAAAAGIIYLGCLVHAIYQARKDKKLAKKLENYLPREGSQIPAIISLLTLLLVKDKIETHALLRNKPVPRFNYKDFVGFFKNLSDPNAIKRLTQYWSKEQKEIVKLAEEFSKQIFKNLGKYDKERKLPSDYLHRFVPTEVFHNKKTPRVEQDRVCLIAWLRALDKLVQEQFAHDQSSYREDLVKVYKKTIDNLGIFLEAKYKEINEQSSEDTDTETDTVCESEDSSLFQQNAARQARKSVVQADIQDLAENDSLPKEAFPISPISGHRHTFFSPANLQDECSGSHRVNSNNRRYCISSEV